jgi:hypothetical protein
MNMVRAYYGQVWNEIGERMNFNELSGAAGPGLHRALGRRQARMCWTSAAATA